MTKPNKIIYVLAVLFALILYLQNCGHVSANKNQSEEIKELKKIIINLKAYRDTIIKEIPKLEVIYKDRIKIARISERPDTIIKNILNTDSVSLKEIAVRLTECELFRKRDSVRSVIIRIDSQIINKDSIVLEGHEKELRRLKKYKKGIYVLGSYIVIERLLKWFF